MLFSQGRDPLAFLSTKNQGRKNVEKRTQIHGCIALITMLMVVMCSPARAELVMPAYHSCFVAAGHKYQLSPLLLKGIALAESSGVQTAKNLTHIKRTKTVDAGLMQINSSWFPLLEKEYGIKSDKLNDACMSIDVGAWILAHEFKKYGNTWEAVGAYNAACTQLKGAACAKARQTYVWRVFKKMQMVEATEKSTQDKQKERGRS
ncbi:lytic transglycosylase domain-containing protein [Aquabacterium sp. NJ1]|uniref:lytic transglycosylase domain-containing protein n=1 Tax=Aquabacterium sp. NJ1 TaxID=1538295 RepID=UPI000689EC0F|nr:lytic transglycosylase domain-containing protein [Aquabacterium sp. NJ1]